MPASKYLSLRNLPADTPYSLRNLRLPQVTVSGLKLPQVGDGLVGVDLVIIASISAVIALLAAWIPARRASQLNPAQFLH